MMSPMAHERLIWLYGLISALNPIASFGIVPVSDQLHRNKMRYVIKFFPRMRL